MRKTLLGAVSTIALLSFGLPAADAAPVPVDGDHFRHAGLTYVSQHCGDYGIRPPTEPTVRIVRGPKTPPLGSRSLGWDMQEQTTYGAGVLGHVPDPRSLKKASIKVFFVGGSGQGAAYAAYHAPDDWGVWRGVAVLPPDSTSGWHGVNFSNLEFKWLHYTGETQNGEDPASTLQDLAARHGGNGGGAEIGLLFGCSGETFYVDDFQLASRRVNRTYDLGGYRTVSDIVHGSVIKKKITITYGQRLGLWARLRAKHDFSKLSGRLRIDARKSGSTRWRKYDRVPAGGDFTVAPSRTTTYRTVFAGNDTYRASDWRPLLVRVRSLVKANFADATVTKGHSFTARGRVLPGRRAKLLLQHRVHRHWRTVKKTRSARDGRFHVSLLAGSTGTSYWRIVARSGGGNLQNHSRKMTLKVTAPQDTSGGGGTTQPPPDDPTVPPPTH